jgi:hypothetical protein
MVSKILEFPCESKGLTVAAAAVAYEVHVSIDTVKALYL